MRTTLRVKRLVSLTQCCLLFVLISRHGKGRYEWNDGRIYGGYVARLSLLENHFLTRLHAFGIINNTVCFKKINATEKESSHGRMEPSIKGTSINRRLLEDSLLSHAST
jgi:hypothetical protein